MKKCQRRKNIHKGGCKIHAEKNKKKKRKKNPRHLRGAPAGFLERGESQPGMKPRLAAEVEIRKAEVPLKDVLLQDQGSVVVERK